MERLKPHIAAIIPMMTTLGEKIKKTFLSAGDFFARCPGQNEKGHEKSANFTSRLINERAFRIRLKPRSQPIDIQALLKALCASFIGFFLAVPCAFGEIYPFAMAYVAFCVYRFSYFTGILAGIAVCASLFVFAGVGQAFSALGVMASVVVYKKMSKTNPDKIKISLIAFGASLSFGGIARIITGADIIGLLMTFANASVCLAITPAFISGFGAIENAPYKKSYTSGDVILISICICAVISGFIKIAPFNISISFILFCAYILIGGFCFTPGICLSGAVLSSGAMCLFSSYEFSYMGLFAICALICVLTSSLNKYVCALSFVAAVSLGSALIGQNEVLYETICACIGAVIFLLSSGYITKKAQEMKCFEDSSSLFLNETLRSVIREEMLSQREMLSEMAKNITRTSKQAPDKNETVNKICRMISSDVCPGCPSYASCWTSSPAYTYEAFAETIRLIMRESFVSYDKLPKEFYARCAKSRMMFKMICYIYDSFKLTQDCKRKLSGMKSIVEHQFSHLSSTLEKLYSRLSDGLYIDAKEAAFAQSELENCAIKIDGLYIIEDFNKKKRVFLHTSEPLCEDILSREIPRVLSSSLAGELIYDYCSSPITTQNGFCYIYREEYPFRLSCGFASCKKNKTDFSGDNNTNTILSNGIHAVAICDGMGSGIEASKQSERVLDMLEVLLNAGFDETKAIDMINSVLVLDDSIEISAALDLFLFDLNNGIGEFVKAGACASYIKRGKETIKVSYDTLPMGILDETHIHKGIQKFAKGDYVYFMSDGFFESVGNDETYVRSSLIKHSYRNPQKVADAIFNDALTMAGNVAKDDVSVMVVKVRQ